MARFRETSCIDVNCPSEPNFSSQHETESDDAFQRSQWSHDTHWLHFLLSWSPILLNHHKHASGTAVSDKIKDHPPWPTQEMKWTDWLLEHFVSPSSELGVFDDLTPKIALPFCNLTLLLGGSISH